MPKNPANWTPDEAAEMEKWVTTDSGQADVSAHMQLAQYREASQVRQALKRDPEILPPKQTMTPGLAAMKMLFPKAFGGQVEQWREPLPDETKAMEPALRQAGVDVDQFRRDYADARWAQAHDQAQQSGTFISRVGNALDEGPKNSDKLLAGRAMAGLRGYAGPVADVVTGIADSKLGASLLTPGAGDILSAAEESVPMAERLALGVAGSALPGSPMARLGGALGRLVGAPKGVLGGVGKGALGGMAMSVGQGTAEDLTRGIADAFNQGDVGKLGDAALEGIGNLPARALVGGLTGGALGLGGGVAAANRGPGSLLPAAEAVGIKTSTLKGLEPPPALAALEKTLGPKENLVDVAAERAAPFVARGAHDIAQQSMGEMNGTLRRYLTQADMAPESVGKASAKPLVSQAIKSIRERSFSGQDMTDGGSSLPVLSNGQLKEILRKSARAEVVPTTQIHSAAQAGKDVIGLPEAIKLGLVDDSMPIEPVRATTQPTVAVSTLPPTSAPTTIPGMGTMAPSGPVTVPEGGPPTVPGAPPSMGPTTVPGSGPATSVSPMSLGTLGVTTPSAGIPPMESTRIKLGEAMGSRGFNPESYHVVYTSRRMTAKETVKELGAIDNAANAAALKGDRDPVFADMMRAVREVRDQLPDPHRLGVTGPIEPVTIQPDPLEPPIELKGFSAFMHRYSEALGKQKREMGFLGLPETFDPGDPVVKANLRGVLGGLMPKSVGSTDAIRLMDASVAHQGPSAKAAVDNVQAANLLGGPMNLAPIGAPGGPVPGKLDFMSRVVERGRYHTDPLAQLMGRLGPRFSGITGSLATDPLTKAIVDLAHREKTQGASR